MELKVTNEMRERIIAERKAGQPYAEIATKFGLSRPYVNNICLSAGLTTYTKRTRRTRSTPSPVDREMEMEELSRLLLHEKTDPVIIKVGRLIEEMLEAGEGGTFYSDGTVGLCISPTEIEIVDTRTGAIASLLLRFKNEHTEEDE